MDYDARIILGLRRGLADLTEDGQLIQPNKESQTAKADEEDDTEEHGHPVYCDKYDYIFCSDRTLEVFDRKAPVDPERFTRLLKGIETLPNHHYPSDHLPVFSTLQFRKV